MSSKYHPKYIKEILQELDTTDNIENVLIEKSDIIN